MLRLTAFVTVFMLVVGGCSGPSREDYEQVANSELAFQERDATAKAADEHLAALRDSMPWLQWRDSALDQLCQVVSTSHMSQVFGPSQGYVSCSTTATQYAVFDVELPEEIQRFDETVTKAQWTDSGSSFQQSIDYYRDYRGTPRGPRAYDAGNLPGVSYYRHSTTPTCSRSSPPWRLEQRWLEAGQPLSPMEQNEPVIMRTGDALFQQSPRSLDHRAVKTALLAQHRYVAVVTLSLQCGHSVSD